MIALEIILFIVAYTTLIISLSFGIICYRRKIESKETIALTLSLILLVVCISISPLLEKIGAGRISELLTVISMTIVGCTTWMNTLSERKHSISKGLKKIPIILGGITVVTLFSLFLSDRSQYALWLSTTFLLFSILISFVIVGKTAPLNDRLKKTKFNRWTIPALTVIVPLYLIYQFAFYQGATGLSLGSLLPLFFSLLAVTKILEDLERLANYHIAQYGGATTIPHGYGLTERENEVAHLLAKGCSYSAISEQLFISIPTVKTHTSNVYKKCNVKSKYELIQLLNQR